MLFHANIHSNFVGQMLESLAYTGGTMTEASNDSSRPITLAYAPPRTSPLRRLRVIPAGLFTTSLTFAGLVWLTNSSELRPLGWYWSVFPAGALILGAIAGSGYALASRSAGLRTNHMVAWLLTAAMIVTYFAAHYIVFRAEGPFVDRVTRAPVSFARYYHENTVGITMTHMATGEQASGAGGYVLRLFEIACFAGAPVIMLMSSGSGDYCELCQRFRQFQTIAAIPAAVRRTRRYRGPKLEEFEADCEEAMEHAARCLAEATSHASDADATAFLAGLSDTPRSTSKIPANVSRIVLDLHYCPSCHDGSLVQVMHHYENGKLLTKILPSIKLPRDFVTAVLRGRSN